MFDKLAGWVDKQTGSVETIIVAIAALAALAFAAFAAVRGISKISKNDWKEGVIYVAGALMIGIIGALIANDVFRKFGTDNAPKALSMLPIMLPLIQCKLAGAKAKIKEIDG